VFAVHRRPPPGRGVDADEALVLEFHQVLRRQIADRGYGGAVATVMREIVGMKRHPLLAFLGDLVELGSRIGNGDRQVGLFDIAVITQETKQRAYRFLAFARQPDHHRVHGFDVVFVEDAVGLDIILQRHLLLHGLAHFRVHGLKAEGQPDQAAFGHPLDLFVIDQVGPGTAFPGDVEPLLLDDVANLEDMLVIERQHVIDDEEMPYPIGVDHVLHLGDDRFRRPATDKGGVKVLGSAKDALPRATAGGLDQGERIAPSQRSQKVPGIVKQGAILSEFPILMSPDRNNFPARNRILSGLALGTGC